MYLFMNGINTGKDRTMSKNWYKVIERTRTSSTPNELRGNIKVILHVANVLFWSKENGADGLTSITIEPYPYYEDEERKEYKRLQKKYGNER